MNTVSRTRLENFPVKSRIPVLNPQLKSKIPVPVQASKLSNLNAKNKGNVSKKMPPVSLSVNVKRTTLSQKPSAPIKKSQKQLIKSEKAPGNKTVTSSKSKPLKVRTEQQDDNKSNVDKVNTKQTTSRNLLQVNEQKGKSKLIKADTKKTVLKENKDPCEDNLPSQNDIKFEANEFYRNMILSERELSPSILKLQPGIKLSAVRCERPSAYKKFELCTDPFQEARQAIEKLSLSIKKNNLSSVKRESKPPAPSSPFKMNSLNRQSFYTPCSNPQEELLRSLQELKEKQMLKKTKSAKKVTFNLTVEECSTKVFSNRVQTPFKNPELTQIIEKSEENTPNSPQNKADEAFPLTSTEQSNPQTFESDKSRESSSTLCSVSKSASVTQQICAEKHSEITVSENSELHTPMTKVAIISTASIIDKNAGISNYSSVLKDDKEKFSDTIFHNLRKLDGNDSSPDVLCDNVKEIISVKCDKSKIFCTSVSKNVVGQDLMKSAQAKVYTPRPVSFYSKSRLTDSASPEFLANNPTDRRLSQYAPICTPLVLKNLAQSPGSPEATSVRLKLDFTEEEKETPKKTVTKTTSSINFKKIETLQKKLEHLADDECRLLLMNENTFPVVCGRYLQNPIAQTLSEGDEMHFIPIAF